MQPILKSIVVVLAAAYMAVAQPTIPTHELTVSNINPVEAASGPGVQPQSSAVMEPVVQPLQNAWVSDEDQSTGESVQMTVVSLQAMCRTLNTPLSWVETDEQCGLEQQAPFSGLALGPHSNHRRPPLCAKVAMDESANQLCERATPEDTVAVVVQVRSLRGADKPQFTVRQATKKARELFTRIHRHSPYPNVELFCFLVSPFGPYLPGPIRLVHRLSCMLSLYSHNIEVLKAFLERDWFALALTRH